MTREHKLALIVGFALVLAVAILVSDHFSGASRAQGGAIIADNAQRDSISVGGRQVAFDLPAARQITDANQTPDALASADRQDPSVLESLANSVKTALNDLGNGHTPPVTLQTTVLDMGKPLAGSPDTKPETKPDANPQNTPARTIDPRDLKRHNVASGESLWSIAEKYYGDGNLYKQLAAYNKGRVGDGGAVNPGVTLLIPPKNILVGGDASGATTPDATPRKPATTATREYVVKSGDTLGEIAKKELGSAKRWREIVDLNKDVIPDPDHVAAGTKIKLPRN